jgi:hypothetical protein
MDKYTHQRAINRILENQLLILEAVRETLLRLPRNDNLASLVMKLSGAMGATETIAEEVNEQR